MSLGLDAAKPYALFERRGKMILRNDLTLSDYRLPSGTEIFACPAPGGFVGGATTATGEGEKAKKSESDKSPPPLPSYMAATLASSLDALIEQALTAEGALPPPRTARRPQPALLRPPSRWR